MYDGDIRRRARQIYRRHIGAALLLGWIYQSLTPLSDWIAAVLGVTGGLWDSAIRLIIGLVMAPLSMGALACILQMFEDDHTDWHQVTQFYRNGQWAVAMGLFGLTLAIALGGTLLIMLLSLLVFNSVFAVIALLVGLCALIWLMLRFAMARLLLVIGESHTATDALSDSYHRMKDNVLEYAIFCITVEWIPVTISIICTVLMQLRPETTTAATIFAQIVTFVFAPYIVLAQTGWLAQLIRRRPQEAEGTSDNPILRQIEQNLPKPEHIENQSIERKSP